MKTLKLLYVHGYLGHGNGSASRLLKAELDKRGISYSLDAPDFPVTKPELMSEQLQKRMTEGNYDYVIASSLGAFYTLQTFGPMRILVNPALPENLRAIRDAAPEENPELTDELLEKLQEGVDYFFRYCHDDESVFLTYFVYGTRDTIAGNEAFFSRYYRVKSHIFHVDMEHRLDPAGAEQVCDILEKLEADPPHYVNQLEWFLEQLFADEVGEESEGKAH